MKNRKEFYTELHKMLREEMVTLFIICNNSGIERIKVSNIYINIIRNDIYMITPHLIRFLSFL